MKIGGVKLKVQGDITQGDCFMVVGPNYYGYGNTIKEAKANCIKSGCPRKAKMIAYYGDADMGIDNMGTMHAKQTLVSLGEV